MTARRKKILTIVIGAVLGLLLLLTIAGAWVAQSPWFHEYVRQRIVQAVEDSTGGRAEIGEFRFDWRHLRVEIREFVLHGTESPDQDALFRARSITAELRFLSLAKRRKVDIASLDIQEPRANLVIDAAGRTNIPEPKVPKSSDKSALDTLVDLAIGRFSIQQGSVRVADQEIPISIQGENLAAQFSYELVPGQYRGKISLQPLLAQYAQNKRAEATLNVGLLLGRDRIELSNATLATPRSNVQISGTGDHLASPQINAKASGHIDLVEMKEIFGTALPISIPNGSPHVLEAQFEASADDREFRIASAKLTLGGSSVDASGAFRNTKLENGSVQFRADLALAELARMLDPAIVAAGELELGGEARLNGVSDYRVNASMAGTNIAFRRGDVNLSNIRMSSKIEADPARIDLSALTILIGPGQLNGSATLEEFSRYRLKGNLSRLDLQDLLASVTSRRVDYAGALSGPIEVAGDLKRSSSLTATARLNLAPAGRGVPISGNINVNYDGPMDTVSLRSSYIALPSSRLEFSGALGSQIDVHLVSRNLEDFRPALSFVSSAPAKLPAQLSAGGSAVLDAKIAGRLSAPNISGHLAVTKFSVEQRHFDQLVADITAANNRIAVDGATLRRDSLLASFQGAVGLEAWAIKPASPVMATASIQNGNVLDVLAFAGQSDVPVSGDLSLQARISGTIGDPQGSANVRVANGMAYGEPLDLAEGQLVYGGQKISVPSLRIESGPARANLSATFEHPQDTFSQGSLRVHVDTNQIALARLKALQRPRMDLDGNAQVNLDAELALESTNGKAALRVVTVNGTLEGRGLRRQNRNLGDVTARIQTDAGKLGFRLVSNFAGSKIDANGETDLTRNYETSANVDIQDLPIQEVLALAGRTDIAASGLLSAKGDVTGTLADPRGNLDITLNKAILWRQPIDRLEGHVSYSDVRMELENGLVQMGTSRISLSGTFTHPAKDFSTGDVTVRAQGNQVQLTQIVALQDRKPGIAGTLQISIDGAARLHPPGTAARVTFSSLNASTSLTGVRAQGKDFGNLTARISGTGSTVTGTLESDLAQSSIKATLRTELTGDYPSTGQITLSGVHYANWAGLIGNSADRQNFDVLLEGSANVSGPILKPELITGSVELTKAELFATSAGGTAFRLGKANPQDLALKNDGPVSVIVDRSGLQVKSARWTGPSSQLSVSGSVVLRPLAFNLDLNADADLALIHRIRDDISSDGHLQLNASVKGSVQEPVINGKVELRDAAFQTADMPNGISKATGVILFSGTTATIQSLTAESGGGRLTFNGTVSRFGGQNAYNLGLRANRVQIRTKAGASVGVNADLKLSGTQQARVLSGSVTIRDVGFNPRSDLGTMLAETADPPPTPSAPGGFLASTRLALSIKTAPAASFQSAYTTSLDANADLTMRGTLANPGMLGRISISGGELVFFGSKYSLDSGSVSFFNPTKIDPILDLNMETTARGVQVTLNVTGPVHNMNLAYQSDPPLQFSEIVGLLAAGRMPTSDPVLLARQPAVPAQSFQQMGQSAILNKVVTNPVSGQLKRVFGVTELKIDPTFTSGSELPQARLTLQQNVTKQLTFTYITNLTRADSQILRAEWALNPRWSAVATRQENGLVGVDLFYKRRIH